jgi:hypothetical protein
MFKQTHTYEDYDGSTVTEDLYFNINRIELGKNLHIVKKFEDAQKQLEGPERDLKPEEIKMVLDLVEILMKLAYGVRDEKNGRMLFVKNEEIWLGFAQAAIYDSYLFWLFENPKRVEDFMQGLMPKELREEAAKVGENLPQSSTVEIAPSEEPIGEKKFREMSREEQLQAFKD